MALDAVYSPEDLGLDPRSFQDTGRLLLLVHPHPDDPRSAWPPGGDRPVFGQSSLRAFNMQRAQSLYQDLQTLEKYNARLRWRTELERVMSEARLGDDRRFKDLADAAWRERIARRARTKPHAPPLPEVPSEGSEVKVLLDAATGTAGKHAAWVEVVSPDLDPEVRAGTKSIRDRLAGERLGHFLGFADIAARKSDFRLGYENFRTWWQGDSGVGAFRDKCGLPGLSVPDHECLTWPNRGDFSTADISWWKRVRWGWTLSSRYFRELRLLLKASKRP